MRPRLDAHGKQISEALGAEGGVHVIRECPNLLGCFLQVHKKKQGGWVPVLPPPLPKHHDVLGKL